MTLQELNDLMQQCGLLQVNKLQWMGGNSFVQTDEFIEGDTAALMQLVNIVIKREREECADIADAIGRPDLGRLFRARGQD